jgi:excisionase family DNA binding protein
MATAHDITELASALAELASKLADRENAQEPEPAAVRPMPERVMFTVEEAAQQLGVGRTLMYRLIRTQEVESVRIGSLRRVPASAIQDYAARLVNGTPNSTAA